MATCLQEPKQEYAKNEQSDKAIRVCFVCTGNTCRSPMAAAVANAISKASETRCRQKKIPLIEAISAGLYANAGEPISVHAVEALENAKVAPVQGLDYRVHTAHTVTSEDVKNSDLLIGLSGGHCMELMMRFPQAAQKIVGMPVPITDPYGGDLAVYEACLSQITEGVRQLLFSSLTDEKEGMES